MTNNADIIRIIEFVNGVSASSEPAEIFGWTIWTFGWASHNIWFWKFVAGVFGAPAE